MISDDGEIITNAHVVTNASTAGAQIGPLDAAREVYVQFPDLNQIEAEIVGFDPYSDVALLQVEPDGLDLQPLELGDDRTLVPGIPVAASETQARSMPYRDTRSCARPSVRLSVVTTPKCRPDTAARCIAASAIPTTGTSTSGLPIDAATRSIIELDTSVLPILVSAGHPGLAPPKRWAIATAKKWLGFIRPASGVTMPCRSASASFPVAMAYSSLRCTS